MTAAGTTWEGFAWPGKNEDGRTLQPVRRKSRPSLGAGEPVFRITEKQRRKRLEAFDRLARNGKPKGVRRGHMGDKFMTYSWCAHQVLDYLLGFAVTTGRVYPSVKQISAVLGIAVSQVARVLDQLELGGWIKRERRIRPTTIPAGEVGPQVEQDTNYYRLLLPTAAGELLSLWTRAQERRAGLTPEESDRLGRARRVAGDRRALERGLAQARALLARAARESDRRRLRDRIAEMELAIASALSREAALDPRASQPHGASDPGAGSPAAPPDST
ncbi:MAG: hypothetical protein ACOYXW_11185 [Actinomycetota bacterium]